MEGVGDEELEEAIVKENLFMTQWVDGDGSWFVVERDENCFDVPSYSERFTRERFTELVPVEFGKAMAEIQEEGTYFVEDTGSGIQSAYPCEVHRIGGRFKIFIPSDDCHYDMPLPGYTAYKVMTDGVFETIPPNWRELGEKFGEDEAKRDSWLVCDDLPDGVPEEHVSLCSDCVEMWIGRIQKERPELNPMLGVGPGEDELPLFCSTEFGGCGAILDNAVISDQELDDLKSPFSGFDFYVLSRIEVMFPGEVGRFIEKHGGTYEW